MWSATLPVIPQHLYDSIADDLPGPDRLCVSHEGAEFYPPPDGSPEKGELKHHTTSSKWYFFLRPYNSHPYCVMVRIVFFTIRSFFLLSPKLLNGHFSSVIFLLHVFKTAKKTYA